MIGTASGAWTDPHNGGKYAVASSSATALAGTRTTANGQYTDKFAFSFAAVSESQGKSGSVAATALRAKVVSSRPWEAEP